MFLAIVLLMALKTGQNEKGNSYWLPERAEFFDTERQELLLELFRCVGKTLRKSNRLLSKENRFQFTKHASKHSYRVRELIPP